MNISDVILLTGAVTALLYYVFFHVPREQKKQYKMKLQDLQKFYTTTNNLAGKTNIERTLIWKSENGGGVPRFGYQIYLSVLYENFDAPFTSVIEDYAHLKADGAFIELLSDVYNNEYAAQFTADMQPGILREMNTRDGVTWSFFFKIGSDGHAFYFGQIDTSKDTTPFQNNNAANVNIAINEIRKKYQKLNGTRLERFRQKFYL